MLRTSLVPGLLEVARYNVSRKNTDLKIFELKKVFYPEPGQKLPREVKFLAGLAMGLDQNPHWATPPRPVDFYDVKGCVERLLDFLNVKGTTFVRAGDIPYLHPGMAAAILQNGTSLGILGEMHPGVLHAYEIPGKAYLFEIPFDLLIERAEEGRRFQPLPKFPSVHRDLSIVTEDSLEAEKVTEAIWSLKQPFIEDVNLFDLYHGAPIPEGKKGLSYRIRYQAPDRTLTDEEVNHYHAEIISRLRDTFNAELR